MIYDAKYDANKSGSAEDSTHPHRSSGQSPSASQGHAAPAPSYAEAAAASIATAAEPEPSASASTAQPAAAPEDAVIAQVPTRQPGTMHSQQQQQQHQQHLPYERAPFLENNHSGSPEAIHTASRRAFKRFSVAFFWAVMAWLAMIVVAGGFTEMMVGDVRDWMSIFVMLARRTEQ